MENNKPDLTGPDDAAARLLAAATGGCAPALAHRLMLEVTDTLGLSGKETAEADDAGRIAAALQAMAAAAPRDALEAMLAAQMAAAHGAAMRAMKRAAECTDYPHIEALYARQAARLMGLYMRQTEALERRREKAEKRAAEEARQTTKDSASPPSPTPPPAKGEGRYRDESAFSRPGGGGLGGGGTRQGRVKPHKRNGHRHRINGTGPPP